VFEKVLKGGGIQNVNRRLGAAWGLGGGRHLTGGLASGEKNRLARKKYRLRKEGDFEFPGKRMRGEVTNRKKKPRGSPTSRRSQEWNTMRRIKRRWEEVRPDQASPISWKKGGPEKARGLSRRSRGNMGGNRGNLENGSELPEKSDCRGRERVKLKPSWKGVRRAKPPGGREGEAKQNHSDRLMDQESHCLVHNIGKKKTPSNTGRPRLIPVHNAQTNLMDASLIHVRWRVNMGV